MGAVGRFTAVDWTSYQRGDRVVCRTVRGLEVGRLLSTTNAGTDETANADSPASSDGEVLRKLSIEDQLLVARLEKHRDEAFDACQRLLAERGIDAILVDVEHLFDGQSVYFYFLGEVDEAAHRVTAELAEQYEKSVRFRKFSETLHEGCGPDCGTEDGGGCGDSCGSCAVAAACGVKAREH